MYGWIFLLIALAIFFIQIALCLKYSGTGSQMVLPGLCLLVTAGFFGYGMVTSDGWTGAGLWILGTLSLFPLAACLAGWLTAFFLKKAHKHSH